MNKTTILLPEDLQQRAKRLARKRGTTLSGMIRKQLEHAVAEDDEVGQKRVDDPICITL